MTKIGGPIPITRSLIPRTSHRGTRGERRGGVRNPGRPVDVRPRTEEGDAMNPPTLVTDKGIALCADHAAQWARGGVSHRVPPAGALEGRGCHACESEAFV